MKEYKRFTERLPNGVCRVKCNEHCENFKDSQERMCDAYQECDIAAVGYLAELEDKIEQKKLIELPFIQKGQYGNRWYVYYRKKTGNKNITWKMYYSKAEAEAKLKELQNEY